MKKWIVKQFISLSEVTGMGVPSWIRRWVSPSELEELRRSERQLSDLLRMERQDSPAMPAELKSGIDAALAKGESGQIQENASSVIRFPAWKLAAAALLVVGVSLFLVFQKDRTSPEYEEPLVAVVESPVPMEPVAAVETPSTSMIKAPLDQDLLLKPLATEQARLASDMTNALRFVVASLLPNEYARQVNENLTSLEQEVFQSI